MSTTNDQLKLALLEALEELYNADDEAHADNIVKLINTIRDDLNIILMTNEYVEKYIWRELRQNSSNVQTLMATSATFIQCIDNIDELIPKYVASFVPFNNGTKIVDTETFTKAVDHSELQAVLLSNHWLFFLLYAATNKRIINGFINSILPDVKVKKRGT